MTFGVDLDGLYEYCKPNIVHIIHILFVKTTKLLINQIFLLADAQCSLLKGKEC